MKILGICGSIRKDSYNKRLLGVARTMLEQNATVETFDIDSVPHYNGDDDGETKPRAVQALKDAIRTADALLIVTPEYNYSIPGVLKNAIDWASRPAFNSVLLGKPVGVLSASMSKLGGARAQVHLRDVMAGMLTPFYLAPDFLLASAHNAFDESGDLGDAATEERLRKYLQGYVEWVGRMSA